MIRSRWSEVMFALIVVAICIGFVSLVFSCAHNEADKDCAAKGATPRFTSQYSNYICVTPDGKIV